MTSLVGRRRCTVLHLLPHVAALFSMLFRLRFGELSVLLALLQVIDALLRAMRRFHPTPPHKRKLPFIIIIDMQPVLKAMKSIWPTSSTSSLSSSSEQPPCFKPFLRLFGRWEYEARI